MVASVTRDNSVNQSFKFDITTSGKQKYYRLSSEDVARFLTEDYNRTDNVKTSKLSLFEKFIYIITFGMCDISCDKRNSLKDFFTGFESAINSLDGTFRNPDLHSEPLTECTNLADHNLPAETKALFMIDRFAKLAKCALDVVQARVDINLFAVVFEPSNYGMAPDKLKFMIGNTCITAIDCDRLTRKNLIKTLSNRPDIYEHLNVKKLYIDDKKLVKQYAFEQKRDVLYLDGMLYG
ncbi:MAG: hypothetical protein QG673_274, partial [Pseudomonadota bacterium]|nr:hypothetical protein [Pseudomonadota bacterium]